MKKTKLLERVYISYSVMLLKNRKHIDIAESQLVIAVSFLNDVCGSNKASKNFGDLKINVPDRNP
jgi:hypothetical protein